MLALADVGANIPRSGQRSPYIFANSLGYWQASYAFGSWAAQGLGRRALIVSSFYDSGYDTLYGFRLGFERAGGQIVDTLLSHHPTSPSDHLTELMAQIAAAQPDLVYAISSGPDADLFLRAYADAGLSGRIPLAGTSFTLPEHASGVSGLPAIPMALPWSAQLEHPENRAFTTAYAAATGRQADALALLGYDTAQLLDAIVAKAGDPHDLAAMQQALEATAVRSPRGVVTFDPQTRSLLGPLYLGAARQQGGSVRHNTYEILPAVPTNDPQIAAWRASLPSGWTNAYLSV